MTNQFFFISQIIFLLLLIFNNSIIAQVEERDDIDSDEEKGPKSKLNYASHDAGAVVLDKSSPHAAKGFSNLLNDDKDKYLYMPCTEKKWVVIGLSEVSNNLYISFISYINLFIVFYLKDILVKQFVMANYEQYSSRMREFDISTSQRFPTEEWSYLGTFEAEPKMGEQIFNISKSSAHTRFIKIKFLTYYGNEALCTLSQIKVHGTTVVASLNEEFERSETMMRDMLNQLQDTHSGTGFIDDCQPSDGVLNNNLDATNIINSSEVDNNELKDDEVNYKLVNDNETTNQVDLINVSSNSISVNSAVIPDNQNQLEFPAHNKERSIDTITEVEAINNSILSNYFEIIIDDIQNGNLSINNDTNLINQSEELSAITDSSNTNNIFLNNSNNLNISSQLDKNQSFVNESLILSINNNNFSHNQLKNGISDLDEKVVIDDNDLSNTLSTSENMESKSSFIDKIKQNVIDVTDSIIASTRITHGGKHLPIISNDESIVQNNENLIEIDNENIIDSSIIQNTESFDSKNDDRYDEFEIDSVNRLPDSNINSIDKIEKNFISAASSNIKNEQLQSNDSIDNNKNYSNNSLDLNSSHNNESNHNISNNTLLDSEELQLQSTKISPSNNNNNQFFSEYNQQEIVSVKSYQSSSHSDAKLETNHMKQINSTLEYENQHKLSDISDINSINTIIPQNVTSNSSLNIDEVINSNNNNVDNRDGENTNINIIPNFENESIDTIDNNLTKVNISEVIIEEYQSNLNTIGNQTMEPSDIQDFSINNSLNNLSSNINPENIDVSNEVKNESIPIISSEFHSNLEIVSNRTGINVPIEGNGSTINEVDSVRDNLNILNSNYPNQLLTKQKLLQIQKQMQSTQQVQLSSYSCLETLRFSDFQAKMMAKLQQSSTDKNERTSALPLNTYDNVFKQLMGKIKTLETNYAIIEIYSSQVFLEN
jgi:hypothetical protein